MASSIRFHIDPRDVPPEKAARRLGLPLCRFLEILPRLLSRGFPPSDPDTGNYDLDAIDIWRSNRHKRDLPTNIQTLQSTGVVAERLRKMRG